MSEEIREDLLSKVTDITVTSDVNLIRQYLAKRWVILKIAVAEVAENGAQTIEYHLGWPFQKKAERPC